MSNIKDKAEVEYSAWVGDRATVSGSAHVCGYALIFGEAMVTGSAQVRGYVMVSGRAWIGGNVSLGDNAHVSGTATIREQKHVAWEYFRGRSGVYTLTLFMQANSSIGFVWGCRRGDDLRAYFAERPDYAERGLDIAPLEFLAAFEKANNIGENK